MANITGVVARVPLIKKTYKKFVALGEKATGDDFRMVIEGYPDLEYLVQGVQYPPIGREPVETFGPHGVQFVQQGRPRNIVESPITFVETLSGAAYAALRDWVINKRYLEVHLSAVAESEDGNKHNSFILYDSWVEVEGYDLSVEDATIVKPTGTLHGNWNSGFDTDDHSLEWA